jgi:predicted metal-dependent peptidase
MKIYKALVEIEKNCPEIFYLIRHCKIEVTDKISSASIGKTKSGFIMKINDQWVNNFDQFNLCAIIEHELLHLVLSHCSEISSFSNPKMANVAQDLIINDIGNYFQNESKLNSELQAGCFLHKFNKQYKTEFNSNQNTSLEIYNFLLKQSGEKQEKSKSFDEGFKDDSSNEDSEGRAEENAEIDLEEILSQSELSEIVKKYSKDSKDLKKFFSEIEKRNKDKKIKKAIEQFFNSHKAEFKKSMKKKNKRFSFLPYGRVKDSKQKILIALDVSGSMLCPDDLEKLKMSVNSATSNGFQVDLIFGDTKKIGDFKDIKNNFNFEENIKGGGGTDLKFIFDEKLKDYDCTVIVTDGEFYQGDIPTKLKRDLLFLNTTLKEISGFKNLFI